MLNTGRGMEVEAICEHGTVTGLNDGETWEVRERRGIHSVDPQFREKMGMSQLDRSPDLLASTLIVAIARRRSSGVFRSILLLSAGRPY